MHTALPVWTTTLVVGDKKGVLEEGRSYRDEDGGSGTAAEQLWEGSVARLEVRTSSSVEVLKFDSSYMLYLLYVCLLAWVSLHASEVAACRLVWIR